MLSDSRLSRFVMLPELRLTAWKVSSPGESTAQAKKTSKFEVCPRCAVPSSVIYDHRIVRLRDSPVRGHGIILSLKKRRFFCKPCRKPFNKRKLHFRWLQLKPRYKLKYFERDAVDRWLTDYPELKELYWAREALFSFYRTKGYERASRPLTRLTDHLALSKIKDIRKLSRTLMAWRSEILNYFKNRLTNARTEGFNNVAKLVQKRSYGVKSFEFYRLRYLNACC